jgi:hypothetical protein
MLDIIAPVEAFRLLPSARYRRTSLEFTDKIQSNAWSGIRLVGRSDLCACGREGVDRETQQTHKRWRHSPSWRSAPP